MTEAKKENNKLPNIKYKAIIRLYENYKQVRLYVLQNFGERCGFVFDFSFIILIFQRSSSWLMD